ncbi:P44/Msp2 family outer membrane protein [Candidatus Neoehrlichia procyonis]|uniref:Surface antigen family protein n=1 Tax=Candidatus Neoehrlichia procyonis str. RAC413 TaxID=1359163 RepID=A0A0F3NNS3_9RICK|nr:P44/Msp2 family outer membrane protein [Candidatus Neoehrlichia lotoris]KJV69421.1 surface antigen family protein [Candidatus Neoehrlichia lotoris str. RAC413]
MSFKNLFVRLLIAFFSLQFFSSSVNASIYVGGHYKPAIMNIIKDFLVKGDSLNFFYSILHNELLSNDQNTDSVIIKMASHNNPYNPAYSNSTLGLGGFIGYSNNRMRIEIEVSHEKFGLHNFNNSDDKYLISFYNSSNSIHTIRASDISATAFMINLCHDFATDNLGISPYLCAGAGSNFIEVFDALRVKFIYQAKAGVSFIRLPKVIVFAGGYYEGIINSNFKNLYFEYPKYVSFTAKLNISYFGGEVGVRFTFN